MTLVRPPAARKQRFRIPHGAAAEALVAKKMRLRRAEGVKMESGGWRAAIARKNPSMSYADFIAFRLLRGQFEGQHVPLLPTVVRLARMIVKGVRARLPKATP